MRMHGPVERELRNTRFHQLATPRTRKQIFFEQRLEPAISRFSALRLNNMLVYSKLLFFKNFKNIVTVIKYYV